MKDANLTDVVKYIKNLTGKNIMLGKNPEGTWIKIAAPPNSSSIASKSRRVSASSARTTRSCARASRTGSPNEYVDYAASKGAVDSFTRGLSLEVP